MPEQEKQRVLVVDDEPRNLRIIELCLQSQWTLKTAESGEAGLEAAKSFLPDVVLLDIMMKGMSGYEVCRQLRALPQMKFTKIILVSGKAMLEERLKGYETGADDYVTKPFIPEELAAKVSVFMRLTDAERQLERLNSSLEDLVNERTQQLIAAEAKLVSSAKMSALGEMAGGIAHEINTPLAAIGMRAEQMIELVDENALEPPMAREMAKQIGDTVDSIAKIIFGLLSFSRQGNREVLGQWSAQSFIESALSMCREKLKNHGIELRIKHAAGNPNVYGNSVQASQVMLNLLNNAYDAVTEMPEGSRWIEVEVIDAEGFVEIRVKDSGKKIEKTVQEKMFQPFFTTKAVGHGTGLGLSLSKGLMEACGGSLSFDDGFPQTCFVAKFLKEGRV